MAPLFTLTTDFGSSSSYPAQLKAVLLSAVPDARIVDVTHDVPAYDVLAAALILEAALPWFPREAIHLAVVDPGVGTARRGLVVADPEGRRLVGPDNGLFTAFLGRGPGSARWRSMAGSCRPSAPRPSTAATCSPRRRPTWRGAGPPPRSAPRSPTRSSSTGRLPSARGASCEA
jgi:hypothetical protein